MGAAGVGRNGSVYETIIKTHFSAAHALAGHPGKCRRVHGHTYVVRVAVRGEELDELGMLIDFSDLRRLVEEILEQFDHRNLTELKQFAGERRPTSENIAREIFLALREKLRALPGARERNVELARVEVEETPGAAAAYYERP